ncbi:MAG: 50S ribosomal protein L10 [Candidatus Nealsonbacteria bacterium]|nr:50S ribosomal protein L10 [Candidatus Nealsonbacteria bacterium]
MLSKDKKAEILKDLKNKVAKQKAMVFVDFTGLKVKDISRLRKELKKNQNEMKVAKKTLVNLALKDKNLEIAKDKLAGEVALIFGYNDEVSPARTVYQFSKTNPALKILGGFLENKFKEIEEIIALAQLPSREELLARLVGGIASPMSGFVSVLQGNIKGLMQILSKIKTNN